MAAEMNQGLLPRDRALWQMRVVECLEDGNIAVLAKLHHAMMDGMAGIKFMASLFSRTPEPEPISSDPIRMRRQHAPEPRALVAHALRDLVTRPWRIVRASATTLAQTARPSPKQRRAAAKRSEGLETPRSVLNGPAGPDRRVAYLNVSLGAVRDVAASVDATVNDVVLALVGGALRKALEADGTLPDESLIAGVPVSIHREGDDLANAYSAIFASLHSVEPDAVTRLRRIRDGVKAAKTERRASRGSPLDAWADIPLPLEIALISRAYSGLGLADRLPLVSNCVVSNVPGPNVPLHLAGARVVGIHPLGPIFDGMTLNVTVLGREDVLDFGIVAGSRAPSDVWAFARAIPEELDALAKALGAGGPQRRRESDN
jgi:diacylglycerol O-acyltransferase